MSTATTFPLKHTAATILRFLVDNLVSTKVIGFNYEDQVADHGDVVNVQLAKKIHVPLTEWATVSFRLDQGESERAFANLTDEYFEPCGVALAQCVDQISLFWMAMQAGHRLGTPGGVLSFRTLVTRSLLWAIRRDLIC